MHGTTKLKFKKIYYLCFDCQF